MKNKFLLIFLLLSLCCGAASHRPALLLKEKAEAAVKRAKTDSAYARGIREIIAVADGLMDKTDITRVDYLGAAYMLSGERKYADRAKEVLLNGAKAKTWADKEMMMRNPPWQSELNTAHRLFAVANAYDAIYGVLSPSERKEIASGYWRLAVKPLAEDWILPETRIHTLNSMGHNWWSSCVGMCGIGALAFKDELSDSKPIIEETDKAILGWFAFPGDSFQHKPRTFDRNGGMYECINYAGYGCQEALLYMLARRNVLGKTLEGMPQLDNMAEFFIQTGYPTSDGMMSAYFGDSHRRCTGHNALMLLDALGYGSADIDDYLASVKEGQHKEFMGLSTPVGLLYAPAGKANKRRSHSLPLSAVYPDMGWAAMRDSRGDNATMLAVKSGITWNHAHADAGSFILFHKGKDIIGEAGRCWYKLPEYRNYFFQSEAHNVVLLDGKGQPRFQQYHSSPIAGSVSNMVDTLGVKYILADATGPNSDRFNRYMRSFLWIDGVILIIDDLSSHTQGEYTWLWHPGGETVKRGIDLDIRNGESHVLLRQLFPETLAPSDFIHDYPSKMTWEIHEAPGEDNKGSLPYWSFHLPKSHDRVKGVTAIILDPADAPQIERRQGEGWIGVRISKGGEVTDVYINQLADGSLMHLNSWIAPDGWTTDSYLTALTYRDASALKRSEPSRKAVVYGSTLRNPEGKILLSRPQKTDKVW